MTISYENMPSVAYSCTALAIVLAVCATAAGFGTRMEWWGYRTGLSLLRWSVYGELALFAVSLIGAIFALTRGSESGLPFFVLACTISIAAVFVPFRMYLAARNVPAIHDIATDTENPPQFDVVLSIRKGASNPAEYGGAEIAQQQKKAYPDLAPLMLEVPPEKAFERASSAAQRMGWQVVSADPAKGLIEATDTTFWFGFKDDIVIRITPQGNGSRIDMRSLSRVGRSDVGANAGRIRRYLTAMKKGA